MRSLKRISMPFAADEIGIIVRGRKTGLVLVFASATSAGEESEKIGRVSAVRIGLLRGCRNPELKVYPHQINSFTRYCIMTMEPASKTNPKTILRLRRVSNFIPLPHLRQRPLASLDCSGPTESDGHLALLDNDRDIA